MPTAHPWRGILPTARTVRSDRETTPPSRPSSPQISFSSDVDFDVDVDVDVVCFAVLPPQRRRGGNGLDSPSSFAGSARHGPRTRSPNRYIARRRPPSSRSRRQCRSGRRSRYSSPSSSVSRSQAGPRRLDGGEGRAGAAGAGGRGGGRERSLVAREKRR